MLVLITQVYHNGRFKQRKVRVFILNYLCMVYVVVHNNMARSQVADGTFCLQIWRLNTNILNKPSLAADTRSEQRR